MTDQPVVNDELRENLFLERTHVINEAVNRLYTLDREKAKQFIAKLADESDVAHSTQDRRGELTTKQLLEQRYIAYADVASKAGSGTVVRAYAKARANECDTSLTPAPEEKQS